MKQFLPILFLLAAGAALADPPMKTVYQSGSTTKFTWQWPYHTTQSSTTYQTQLSPAGSGYRQASAVIAGDLSQYRFHNSHLTYQNQWGYFFPAGTRPVKIGNGWSTFITPSR